MPLTFGAGQTVIGLLMLRDEATRPETVLA
jgi:hypothetical protein